MTQQEDDELMGRLFLWALLVLFAVLLYMRNNPS